MINLDNYSNMYNTGFYKMVVMMSKMLIIGKTYLCNILLLNSLDVLNYS